MHACRTGKEVCNVLCNNLNASVYSAATAWHPPSEVTKSMIPTKKRNFTPLAFPFFRIFEDQTLITMKNKRFLLLILVAALSLPMMARKEGKDGLRLLYWNVQNGMWDGQTDDYQRFTTWVKAQNPDICV